MGLSPGYEQKHFSHVDKRNRLCLVASPNEPDGSLTIRQEAFLYASLLEIGGRVTCAPEPGRRVYVQVAMGACKLGDHALKAGDGACITGETLLVLAGDPEAEVLVFDLA